MNAIRITRDYGDLVAALVSRRKAIGMSCMSLDARAGFQEGYANKLENWDKPYGRGLGPVTLRLWLEALGLALVIVPTDNRPISRPSDDCGQLSLDLIGGRMNTNLVRKGFKRFPTLSLVKAA